MNKLFLAARLILGLIFFVFGLNGFFNFLPPQPPLPEAGMNFIMALVNTGYLLKLVKGIEVIAGLALLTNQFSALALIFLSPIVVNIVLFHTLLAPGGYPLLITIVILMLINAYDKRNQFFPLFKA